jgi:hypothetical protein
MSYLRIKPRGAGMNKKQSKYQSRFITVPLADELFDCIQGPFQAYVTVDWAPGEEHPPGEPYKHCLYHTYDLMTVGEFEDPDVERSLRLGFEDYLRRLRAATPLEGKPQLFWRFRKGDHIQIESEVRFGPFGKNRESRVKLRTRLIVPSCTLAMCPRCHHTEGEPHANYCENLVRSSDAEVPQPRVR